MRILIHFLLQVHLCILYRRVVTKMLLIFLSYVSNILKLITRVSDKF